MVCLILAAGYATRMYPLTENFPKPLLEVKGKTILDWMIDDIECSANIEKFVVISNHRFIDYFNKWRNMSEFKEKLILLDDGSTENDNRLGAVKDIVFAIDELKLDDDIMVIAGDNLLDFSLKCFVEFFNKVKATSVMRFFEADVERLKKTGVASIDNNGKIIKMIEKPQKPESNWAIPPFYIYKKDDIEKISLGIEAGCPTDAPGNFISWLCNQTDVYAMEMPGKRYDIGSIKGYEEIKESFEYKQA